MPKGAPARVTAPPPSPCHSALRCSGLCRSVYHRQHQIWACTSSTGRFAVSCPTVRSRNRVEVGKTGMSDFAEHRPLVVGVAGGTGAGKTTVTRAIIEAVGHDRVAQIPEDAYYREYRDVSEAERAAINWDHPNTIEVGLLLEHLENLLAGQAIERPVYDFAAYA